MAKKKQTKKKYNEKEFTKLEGLVKETLSRVKESEKTIDMASLDTKMAERLSAAGFADIGANINKTKGASTKKKSFSFLPTKLPFIANLLIGLSVLIFIGGTSSVGYLWLNSAKQGEFSVDTFEGLSDRAATPSITMFPTSLTESGFVSEDSSFVIELQGELDTKVQDAIVIYPNVEAEFSSEVENGNTIITMRPDQPLERGQKYQITLNSGTEFIDGSESIKEFSWVVPVEPEFAVLGISPRDGAVDVPVDSTIEFEFNHINVSTTSIDEFFTITPEQDGKFQKIGSRIVFVPDRSFEIGTRYSVTLNGGFRNDNGEELVDAVSFSFTTGSRDSLGEYYNPEISWQDGRNFISMTDEIAIRTWDHYIFDEITYKLYELENGDLAGYLLQELDIKETLNEANPLVTKTLPDKDYFRYNPGKNGLFYITAQAGSSKIGKFILLSDLSVVASTDSGSTEGWLFNMNSADPEPGVSISIYKNGSIVDVVQTDSKGYFRGPSADFVVVDAKDNATIWGRSINSQGPYSFFFGSPYAYYSGGSNENFSSRILMDRPVYMSGDEVKGFGVIKEKASDGISAGTTLEKVTVKVYNQYSDYGMLGDYSETPLYEEVVSVDPQFGTFEFSYMIPKSVNSGSLSVKILNGEEFIGSSEITVREYSKPAYKYELTVDGPSTYLNGETVSAVVRGLDYSGSPLSRERVKVRVYRSGIDEQYLASYGFDKISYWSGSSVYQEDTIQLDENGYAEYQFTPYGEGEETHYFEYRIEISPENNDQALVESVSIGVCSSDVDIEPVVNIKQAIKEGGQLEVDLYSKGSWSRDPIGETSFEVVLERTWYERIEEDPVYDEYLKRAVPSYSYEFRSEKNEAVALRTDPGGHVRYSFTDLRDGSYNIHLKYGEVEEVHEYLFSVQDEEWLGDFNEDRFIDISISSDLVTPGETIEAVIAATESINGVFLVVSEDVLESKIISLDDATKFEEIIEISDLHFPSFNICFFGVLEDLSVKSWVAECQMVSVDSDIGVLNLEIETDSQIYTPGDEATVNIRVTDRNGKPTKTMVNLKVVDQKILDAEQYGAYTSETLRNTLIVSLLSGRKYFGVNGVLNLRDDFGGAGGGSGDSDGTREDFAETAFWKSIVTDNNGEASLRFTVPDNLTTWNLTATAVDQTNGVGIAESNIRTNLTRFIDLNIPSYIRTGDQAQIEAVLANYDKNYEAEIEFNCSGCEVVSQKKTVRSQKNSREIVEFSVTPKEGAEELVLTTVVNDNGEKVDDVKYYIPVISSSVIGKSVQTSILGQSDNEYEFIFNVEKLDEYKTSGELYLSRTFALEQFEYPADVQINSTKNISNAILQNTYMLRNYDDLGLLVSKKTLKNETRELLSYLRENQTPEGGFGWFSHTSADLESSVLAARAISSSSKVDIDVSSFLADPLSNYFVTVLESSKFNVHHKTLAFDGLTFVDPERAEMYLYRFQLLFRNSEELQGSAMSISLLMDAYNNLGHTGESSGLVKYLEALSIDQDGTIYWQDSNNSYSLNEEIYVTSQVYRSLAPLEEWELKYKVRNWLVRLVSDSSLKNEIFHEVIYNIAVGDQDAIFFIQNSAEIELVVNNESVANILMNAGDLNSKQVLPITSDLLIEGENKVRLIKKGDAELYSVLTLEQLVSPPSPEGSSFAIHRSFYDLETEQPVESDQIKKGSIVKVAISVTPTKDVTNAVVKDLIPAGFVPVTLRWDRTPHIVFTKAFSLTSSNVNRWGISSMGMMSFAQPTMKKGQTYHFEYLAVAGTRGDINGGGTQVYLDLFPNDQSFLHFGRITVK